MTSDGRRQGRILADIILERDRQDAKWGPQSHPDGTGDPALAAFAMHAKNRTDRAAKDGSLNWMLILNEEFAEACVEMDLTKLREELIQTAAVAVAWIEDIDRRRND